MSVIDVQDVAWDLDPLVDGEGPEGADRMLAEADERAAAFAERYAGNVAELDGPGLAEAMAELQAIAELVGRAGNYARLRFAADTTDPANGALDAARSRSEATAIETKLLFFDLEWAALDDERAEELLAADGLDFAPPPPAHGPPLPAASPHRARGEDHDREGGHRPRARGRGCSRS